MVVPSFLTLHITQSTQNQFKLYSKLYSKYLRPSGAVWTEIVVRVREYNNGFTQYYIETFANDSMCQDAKNKKNRKNVRPWRDTKLKCTIYYCSFTPYSFSVHLTKHSKYSDHTLYCIARYSRSKFPLHTQYSKWTLKPVSFITAIHILYRNITYETFPHTHTHLHYTLQFFINISLINNTVNRGQLRAVQCDMQ